MANKQQLFQALTAARSAAVDENIDKQKRQQARQRATEIASLIKNKVQGQREVLQTSAGQVSSSFFGSDPQAQEQSLQQDAERAERPENPETRAVRNLPELFESGILQGENPAKIAQFAAIASVTTDPQELAEIATNMFPNIGVQQDPGGNVLLGNNKNRVQAVINKPGFSKTDLAQFGGIASAFTPASRVGSTGVGLSKEGLKQAGKGAAAAAGTQAAIETGQAASGGEVNPEQVALAGATQPAASFLGEKVLSPAVRAIRGRVPDEAQEVIQAGKREGVPVMTSDVLPPKGFIGGAVRQFAERVPLLGTGGKRRGQQVAREQAALRLAENTPPANDALVLQELRKSTNTQKRKAGQVISKLNQEMDAAGEVPINNTIKKIDSLIDEFTKPGRPKDKAAIETLQAFKESLTEAPQNFSLLRENRRWLNEQVDSLDALGRSQFQSRSKTLLQGLAAEMNKDMRQFIKNKSGSARVQDFEAADRVYRDLALDMTKTKIKNVLDKGEFSPEAVETILFSSRPSDQQLLFKNLTPKGRQHAKIALIQRAIDKAGGIDDMTPNRLQTQLKKVMDGLETFGTETEKKQLRGLERLLQKTRRAQDSSAITPTGQSQQVPQTISMLAANDFKAALKVVLGGIPAIGARVYESVPVRNGLLRLASVPRGSAKEVQALKELVPAIVSSAQAIRSQEKSEEKSEQPKIPSLQAI